RFASRQVLAGAERDHVAAVVSGANRVSLVGALVDDAVALANLVRVLVQKRQSRAAEHVEDLLGVTVDMRRRRLLAGRELDAGRARLPAAGRTAERRPHARHLAAFAADLLDVVPVRDAHAATLCDGLGESSLAAFYGCACTLVSFQSCPDLGLLDEPAQLLEQDAGGCALAFELLDPVEPGQHRAGLVHTDEASGRKRSALRRDRAFLDSVNACMSHLRG